MWMRSPNKSPFQEREKAKRLSGKDRNWSVLEGKVELLLVWGSQFSHETQNIRNKAKECLN